MARGHLGLLTSFQFFNIGWIRYKTRYTRGGNQSMHPVSGFEKEKFRVVHTYLMGRFNPHPLPPVPKSGAPLQDIGVLR
jgi:hypothetical protein